MSGRGHKSTSAMRLRRWVGLPALLLYSLFLATASLVPEVRPGWLDPAQGVAYGTLKLAGIVPGVPLFQNQHGNDEKYRASCIKARGVQADGAHVSLFPPDSQCKKRGLRLSMPPLELGLFHMIEYAWGDHLAVPPTGSTRLERRRDALLRRIGAYFCRRDSGPFERVELLHYFYMTSYANGGETKRPNLQVRYACDAGEITDQRWFGSVAETVSFWGEPPWE